MFPEVHDSTIRHLRIEQNMSTNDVLISQQEKAKPVSLQVTLASHSHQIINFHDDYVLKTNRSCIWNKAEVFYKRAISTSPNLLKQSLMITRDCHIWCLLGIYFSDKIINITYGKGFATSIIPLKQDSIRWITSSKMITNRPCSLFLSHRGALHAFSPWYRIPISRSKN